MHSSAAHSRRGHQPLWRPNGARLAAVAVLAISCAGSAAGQTTEPALKAAFVYSFAKFAEWPAGLLGDVDPLLLCVVNDQAVADALGALAKGRTIGGHEATVRSIKLEAPSASGCHLLYVSGLDEKRLSAILESTKGASVLTLSDADRFAERGGVARLFVDNGTMAFAVNLDAMHRARITLSSKLLSLARIVKDEPNVR
jgi:hypothetical protein